MVRAPLLAVLLSLLVPAAAQADFDVRAFSVTPSGLQAGSHPDVTIHAEFTPYSPGTEHVRDLTISLPPGLVGDPTSVARCTQAAFQADTCPANTRIGTTAVRTVIPPLQILPVTATGDVYNLDPGAGEPARLGVVVRPPLGASKVFIVSPVRVRPSDGGLDSVITGMPSTVGLPLLGEAEMWIEAMDLTLAAPFASLPTSCRPAVARITAVSGAGTTASRQAPPFTPTGCDQVPYAPSLEAGVDSSRTPSLRTVISVPRGHAATAAAAVTLPRGLSVNLTALRDACTLAEQAAGPCPTRARVGGALARSPLLPAPLTGPVLLALMPGQPLPGLRLELTGPAALTLTGAVGGNPIRTEFAGIPDVPLARFELTFDADRSLRAQTDFCRGKQPMISAQLTGHNGAVAQLTEPLAVAGCRPAATLTRRGRRLTLRVVAVRGTPLERVRVTLPRGVKLRVARVDGRKVRRGRKALPRATRRGRIVTVRARAAQRVVLGLTGRTRKAFAVETRDAGGATVLQRVKR